MMVELTRWPQPLSPADEADFDLEFETLLDVDEEIAAGAWDVTPTVAAVSAGLSLGAGLRQSALSADGKTIRVWLSIDQARQDDPRWDRWGRELGVIGTIETTSNPPRTFSREFRVRVIRL